MLNYKPKNQITTKINTIEKYKKFKCYFVATAPTFKHYVLNDQLKYNVIDGNVQYICKLCKSDSDYITIFSNEIEKLFEQIDIIVENKVNLKNENILCDQLDKLNIKWIYF